MPRAPRDPEDILVPIAPGSVGGLSAAAEPSEGDAAAAWGRRRRGDADVESIDTHAEDPYALPSKDRVGAGGARTSAASRRRGVAPERRSAAALTPGQAGG